MIIFVVGFEMIGQSVDTVSQNCNLHFGRPGIVCFAGMFFNNFGFAYCSNRHVFPSNIMML